VVLCERRSFVDISPHLQSLKRGMLLILLVTWPGPAFAQNPNPQVSNRNQFPTITFTSSLLAQIRPPIRSPWVQRIRANQVRALARMTVVTVVQFCFSECGHIGRILGSTFKPTGPSLRVLSPEETLSGDDA